MPYESERTALFGPFQLDLQTGELRRKGRKIRVQPQPFQLLRLLLEKAGKVVGLDEIRATLWPDAEFVDFEHGVGTAVKKLRDALGDDASRPYYIETLRRLGYRFIAPVSYHTPAGDRSRAKKLVGRDVPMLEMVECLRRALQHQRQVVFLSGEAGIGKTALVDEFLRFAVAENPSINIIRGQCVEGYSGREALYPILEALGQLCRSANGERYVELLAAHAPTLLVQFPALLKRPQRERLVRETAGATRERMLREGVEAVEAIVSAGPLVIVLEDVQWIDPSTIDLLSTLARHRTPASLILIATDRPLEIAASDHPLKAVKQDLLIRRLGHEIALAPLNEAQVAEYLASQHPSVALPAGLAAALYRRSEGNPLFMITALEYMLSRRLVSLDESGWHILVPVEDIASEVPDSLREMIETQIARLTPAEQQALEVASVAGAVFSSEVCAGATDTFGGETFEEICQRLARRRHIVRIAPADPRAQLNGHDRFEFVHVLYRQVFYERQPRGRRVQLHQRIGERLEALSRDRLEEVASELAGHFEEAADFSRAVYYFRLASFHAERGYAHAEAAAFLERALDATSRLPDDERSVHEIAILEKLAVIYVASLDMRAIATYEELCERASHYEMLEVEVRALTSMAFPLSWSSAERCLTVIDKALRLSAGLRDPILRATTRASCYALRLSVAAWNPADVEEFRSAMEDVRESGDYVLIASHQVDLSAIQFSSSHYRDAHRNASESVTALAGSQRNSFLNAAAWRGHVFVAWSLVYLGEWGEALREIHEGMSVAATNGNDKREKSYRVLQAWLHLMAFDYAGALEISRAVLATRDDPGQAIINRFATILSGAAQGGLGRREEAFQLLIEARNDMDRQALIRDTYWRLTLEASLGELWLAMGDIAKARAQAEQFLRLATSTVERTWQALAWELSVRVSMAENDLERALADLAKALEPMDGLEVPLAAWRVHATAAELHEQFGNEDLATEHRNLSSRVILALVNSLNGYDDLQRNFIAAPHIGKILGTSSS